MEAAEQVMTPEQEEQARAEIAAEVFGNDEVKTPAEMSLPSETVVVDPSKGKASEAPAAKSEDEMWTGVNPALRNLVEGMSAKVNDYDSMANRLKQAERRIGSLTTELAETRKAAKEAMKEVPKEEAPTKAEIDKAAKDDAAWEALRADFPEWANAMDARLGPVAQEVKAIRDDLKKLTETRQGQEQRGESTDGTDKDIAALKEQLILTKAHPDYEAVAVSKEYLDWLKVQPAEIQHRAATSPHAADAIKILDDFKKSGKAPSGTAKTAEQIEAERLKRLQSSTTPAGKAARTSVAKREDEMTPDEYRRKVAQEFWPDS